MTTAIRPIPRTLCQQLGRHWAENTSVASGLTFVEDTASAAGNLYAAALPERSQRAELAASLTLAPAPPNAPNSRQQSISIIVEAHAPSIDAALALLTDLEQILWPTFGPFEHSPGEGGTYGVVGLPTLGSEEQAEVWRIVTLEKLSSPYIVPGGGSETRSPDGQAVARMQINASCAAFTATGS